MKFKNQNYPILIAPTHIPELNAIEHTAKGIRFGVSVTLSTLEEVLSEACQSMPGTEVKLNFMPRPLKETNFHLLIKMITEGNFCRRNWEQSSVGKGA